MTEHSHVEVHCRRNPNICTYVGRARADLKAAEREPAVASFAYMGAMQYAGRALDTYPGCLKALLVQAAARRETTPMANPGRRWDWDRDEDERSMHETSHLHSLKRAYEIACARGNEAAETVLEMYKGLVRGDIVRVVLERYGDYLCEGCQPAADA